jgi:hypothetical protein
MSLSTTHMSSSGSQHNNNIDCTYVCRPAVVHAQYRTSLTSVAGCLLVHPRSARLPSRCALAARQPAATTAGRLIIGACSGWNFYPSSRCTNALWGSCAGCPVAELYYRWLLCGDRCSTVVNCALSINAIVLRRRVHCITVVLLLIASEIPLS